MKKNNVILFCLIIIVASILRLWQLGAVPVSPDWDEAALGYNAYSVMHTGRDEYGTFLPIILRSFGDYKPALYMYLAIPSIAVFGLNTFAVRLPSAIFGILTVFVTYFLVKELFRKYSKFLPLLSAFLLAISPWHIQFSRVAFESNIGLSLNVFGALFFLKGLKKPWLLCLSIFCFGANLYAYQSEKVFTPIFLFLLIAIYFKDLLSVKKKYIVTSFIIGFLLLLPLVQYILTDTNVFSRAQNVSIFSSEQQLLKDEQLKLLDDKNSHNIAGTIVHNRRIVYAQIILLNYLSHYNIDWLFLNGDNSRHHVPGMGLLYLWELPFLFIGLYALFFLRFPLKTKLFLFLWFLITPIPASITTDVPHAVRTLNFLPTFQIIIALGLLSAYEFIQKYKILRYFLFLGFLSFAFFNFVFYLNQYFVQQNYFYSQEWQYGYESAVSTAQKVSNKYKRIIVSDQDQFQQSYIFFLYYLRYNPQEYQHLVGTSKQNHSFEKYEFHALDLSKEKVDQNALYIGRAQDFPENIDSIKTIPYLDKIPGITLVEGSKIINYTQK
jgi:4-amino-4-deoxy-L-arabinose transferase-like glycosyltransferase